jgi:hypothetical protein
VCVCVCVFVCVCTHPIAKSKLGLEFLIGYIYMFLIGCIFIFIHTYTYTHIHTYIHTHIYTHTHTHTHSDAKTYPMAKSKLGLEFLREKIHLRVRTNTIASIQVMCCQCVANALRVCVQRVRSCLAFATHKLLLMCC